ncbi:MAG TPA: SpoIIE family protein phosphatase [Solirubrobacterales bacterium]|nr:SpoIIE family protein phosphatase [Solirubrobacterales bacterium]
MLDALADAVTIRAPDDRLIYANQAALERLGLDSVEELRSADPRGLMGGWITTGEDGGPIAMDDLPSVRLLRGARPDPLTLRTVQRESGEERWVVLKATAIRDAGDAIRAAVTIIEDVTAAKRASLRSEFLAEAARVLSSSLDYEETLRNVAALAVPDIADWCAVDLFDAEDRRVQVAIAHVDPSKLEMAERLRAYQPTQLDPDRGLGKVLRTGEPELVADIPDELLAEAAADAKHLELLRAVGLRSALVVPMKVRGRTIGAISMVAAESERRFSVEDVDFAGHIADRAALAVENARLYTERNHIAQTLQQSLLPDSLPTIQGWEATALYRPSGAESEVGGDFYDLWQVGEDWIAIIGDVTGKGVEAAALTSLARHTAMEASETSSEPSYILSRVDAALKRHGELAMCTAMAIRFSGATGTVAIGGHPPLIHLGEGGIRQLETHGSMLGCLEDASWPQEEFQMSPGETVVAITDGVTDALGEGGARFGEDRLNEVLKKRVGEPVAKLLDRVAEALDGFEIGEQADDMALLLMRFRGED